jgi:small subunit ribosomal protein S2
MSNNGQLSLMSLFETGAHRGNSKSKINSKLKDKVYGIDNGLCIINLVETKKSIERAEELMTKLGQRRKQVLVIGTSRHLNSLTKEYAERFTGDGMPYVDHRWLGGTLTNWNTIRKTLKNLDKLENILTNKGFFDKLARNEQLQIQKEVVKLRKFFGGLVGLKNNRPGALLVLDAKENAVAIQEADNIGIPVICLTNINAKYLPKSLNYTIVCNINSINTVRFITDRLVNSYNQSLASGLPVNDDEEDSSESENDKDHNKNKEDRKEVVKK